MNGLSTNHLANVQSLAPAQDVFTDLNSLQKIRTEERDAALKKVAQQFESMFLSMMLKSMRAANAIFEQDNFMHSNESDFYRDMYDKQMALHMSQQKNGSGLADVLYRQLLRQYGENSDKSIQSALALPNSSRSIGANSKTPTESFNSPEEFVEKLFPLAKATGKKLGVQPEWLLAQAALETGWGSKIIKDKSGLTSNNLFNIKAGSTWQGGAVETDTLEYHNGNYAREKAQFRQYASVAESFNDYVALLTNNTRYQNALSKAGNGKEFIEGLQQAGYATDPNYAEKINSVYERIMAMTKNLGADKHASSGLR